MQKSIWKAMFLLVAIAALKREVTATPIISQVARSVSAHVDFDHSIDDSDFSNSPGPVDLSAAASDFRGFGFMEATASQHSIVDAFGFSYESALDLSGQGQSGVLGDSRAVSRFLVTYDLDQPFAYKFTQTIAGTHSFSPVGFSLNGSFSFPTSGVLQPGSYTLQLGCCDLGEILIMVARPDLMSFTATLSADLQLTPLSVSEGNLPGSALLLASAIGAVLWLAKWRIVRI
jgi:hypothetical protein